MQLLGPTSSLSSLTELHYQELLSILNEAIASGDLSGGDFFDRSVLLSLQQQGSDFSSLPQPTAGLRATDDTFNNPLAILAARYMAINNEAAKFIAKSEGLLDVIDSETLLIDRLLAADSLAQWLRSLYSLLGSPDRSWDFGIGVGPVSSVATADPLNSVVYTQAGEFSNKFWCNTGTATKGLFAQNGTIPIPLKDLEWTAPLSLSNETDYGSDWTELDMLFDLPQVSYNSAPLVSPILPSTANINQIVNVIGTVSGGIIPTYVRIIFHPRRNSFAGAIQNNQSFVLSPYEIDIDSVQLFTDTQVYTNGTDYTVDASGNVTPLTISNTPIAIGVRFTEYYPAYQCSLDQVTWSSLTMLDVNRPFPDDATLFYPIAIQNGMFPLTDEDGRPNGLYFNLLNTIDSTYTFLVKTPGAASYGPQVTLEVDLSEIGYASGISLNPYGKLPCLLQTVEVEGFTPDTRHTVFHGSYLLDEETQITWDRQITNRVYLTFVQQNYTVKDYTSETTNDIRRETIDNIQALIPSAARRVVTGNPTQLQGFKYSIAFQSITPFDQAPVLPCVETRSAGSFTGIPYLVQVDWEGSPDLEAYLCYTALGAGSVVLDSNTLGIALTNGQVKAFPFSSSLNRNSVVSVNIDLKFVMRTAASFVSRYNVQVPTQ